MRLGNFQEGQPFRPAKIQSFLANFLYSQGGNGPTLRPWKLQLWYIIQYFFLPSFLPSCPASLTNLLPSFPFLFCKADISVLTTSHFIPLQLTNFSREVPGPPRPPTSHAYDYYLSKVGFKMANILVFSFTFVLSKKFWLFFLCCTIWARSFNALWQEDFWRI